MLFRISAASCCGSGRRARAKPVTGLDEVTRAALEAAEEKAAEDAQPVRDKIVALASRRR